jgi:hypothetical protein
VGKAFPDRVWNSALAEATILGTAMGYSLAGFMPVVEVQFRDYIHPGWQQLVDEIATMRWRSNGIFACPMVIRVAYGDYLGGAGAIWHSEAAVGPIAHYPGLRVVVPSLGADAVGLLRESTPPDLWPHLPVKEWEPLAAMADYKYVLSLWGNHPFNPRLYRGLEAGSLVFHQATPTIRLLEDGILVPGEHYVEVAPDLCDLVEKVEHFSRHPSEAREIADAGHRVWMQTLFVSTPFTIPEVIWERYTSQPNWRDFRDTFAMN